MKILNEDELREKSIEELVELFKYHSDKYYNDEPEISDQQFDFIRELIEEKDPDNGILSVVGADIKTSAWDSVDLPFFAGSLKKSKDFDELKKWADGTGNIGGYVVSAKMDGGSLIETYKGRLGKRMLSATRGNGAVGENITERFNHDYSFSLGYDIVHVRGEAVISKKNFEEIYIPKNYKNSRNTSNLIRSPNSDISGVEILYYYMDGEFDSEREMFDVLLNMGLPVVWHRYCNNIEEVKMIYDDFENGDRDKFPFEIDGLVVTIDDRRWHEKLGWSSGRPNYSRALKFSPKKVETYLESVTWELGDSGQFTPIGHVTPVSDGFVTIRNVNLHNMNFIREKGVKIGSKVLVGRSGDVIPYLYKALD